MRWTVFAVALTLRLAIAFLFFGSVDVSNNMIGTALLLDGVPAAQLGIPHFPGVHLLIWAAGVLAAGTEVPASFFFKFSGCLYDAAIAALLVTGRGRRAGWLYALAPVPILIFSIHGQWDSLCLALLLGSLLAIRRPGPLPAVVSGVLFVLAAIAKPIAIPFAPLFLERKRVLPVVGGMAGCFLAWLGVLWLIGQPLTIDNVDHVFRYARDGVTYFGAPVALGVKQNRLLVLLPMLVLIPMYWTGRVRREDAIVLFYAFTLATCGLSAQYLCWIVPFLLLRGHETFAALYSLLAGLFLVTFYVSPFGGFLGYNFENLAAFAPLDSFVWLTPAIANVRFRLEVIRTIGDYAIPLACLAFLVLQLRSLRRQNGEEPPVPPALPAAPVWVAMGISAVMVGYAWSLPRASANEYPGRMEAKFDEYNIERYRPPIAKLQRTLVIPLNSVSGPFQATSFAYAWVALWVVVVAGQRALLRRAGTKADAEVPG